MTALISEILVVLGVCHRMGSNCFEEGLSQVTVFGTSECHIDIHLVGERRTDFSNPGCDGSNLYTWKEGNVNPHVAQDCRAPQNLFSLWRSKDFKMEFFSKQCLILQMKNLVNFWKLLTLQIQLSFFECCQDCNLEFQNFFVWFQVCQCLEWLTLHQGKEEPQKADFQKHLVCDGLQNFEPRPVKILSWINFWIVSQTIQTHLWWKQESAHRSTHTRFSCPCEHSQGLFCTTNCHLRSLYVFLKNKTRFLRHHEPYFAQVQSQLKDCSA